MGSMDMEDTTMDEAQVLNPENREPVTYPAIRRSSTGSEDSKTLLKDLDVKVQKRFDNLVDHVLIGMSRLGERIDAIPTRTIELSKSTQTDRSPTEDWQRLSAPFQPAPAPAHPPQSYNARVFELQNDNDILKSQKDQLADKLARVEKQLREVQDEVKKAKEKEDMFRTIILDKAGTQKISDEEIGSAFLKLRQRIQAIARNPSYSVDQAPSISGSSTTGMKQFYDPSKWKKMSTKDRSMRMRAEMFSLIHFYILDCDCFGLEGFEAEEGDQRGMVEGGLSRLEQLMIEKRIPGTTIADWRITTLNCIEQLRLEEGTTKYTTKLIFNFFVPILSKHVKLKEEDELKNTIWELCKDAFKLRMLMRKSREGYRCEVPNTRKLCLLSEHENMAYSSSVEGGKNNEGSDEILYTLFGALTKHPEYKTEDKRILEKAEVVLKRR